MESLSKSANKDSILMTYLRSGAGSPMKSPGSDRFSCSYQRSSSGSSRSPLSPLENVKTPMMAEDEVLVMDGVLVAPVTGSGSSSNSSSSSSGKSVYKKELCRAWEDLRNCRYASSCQFSHGKEELHPTHFPIKKKAVVHACKSYATSPRSSPYAPKCRFLPPAMTKAAVAANQTACTTGLEYNSISPITISSEKFSENSDSPISTPAHFGRTCISARPEHWDQSLAANIKSEDSRLVITATSSSDYWSPQDDGIEIALPRHTDKCISREEVDAYTHNILYGPRSKKRLPLFSEFCPG